MELRSGIFNGKKVRWRMLIGQILHKGHTLFNKGRIEVFTDVNKLDITNV